MALNKNGLLNLDAIPYKVLVSAPQQTERRANVQGQLADLGIEAEWKKPVRIEDIDWTTLPSAFRKKPKYGSHTLTLIEIFEEAKRRKVDHFMHIEDDVIFHPEILGRLAQINFPKDWKFIYLGGRNWGAKRYVSEGLVAPYHVYDLHAVIIRTEMVGVLKKIMLDGTIDSPLVDNRIALLHKDYPTYLCRPNLAWQSVHLDETGLATSNYENDGAVKAGQGD